MSLSMLIQSLLAVVHLSAVGLAAVGPLLAGGFRLNAAWRRGSVDKLLYRLARWSVIAIVAAALAGLLAGFWRAWTSDGAYLAMLERFSSRAYTQLGTEWLFTLACYGAWLALWKRWREKPKRHAALALVGATNLLYHFPPLMVAQNLLANQPELISETEVTRALILQLIYSPQVLAKTIHIWGTGLLVSSAAMLLVAGRQPGSNEWPTLVRWTATAGLMGMVTQWASGLAVLLVLPASVASRLTGGSLLATGLLILAVLLVVHLTMHLSRLALQPVAPLRSTGLAGMVVCVMLLMSLIARM